MNIQIPKQGRIEVPDSVSSDFEERSHIRETLEMEIGIWRGFLNTMSTFTGSAKQTKKENTRSCITT